MSTPSPNPPALPALWHEPAPRHFDSAIPWPVKLIAFAIATLLAVYFWDRPVADWARAHPIPDLAFEQKPAPATSAAATRAAPLAPTPSRGDAGRELLFLEQFGQGVCSVLAVLLVAGLDPQGRRRALAVAIACLATLAITHLVKDLSGRARPFIAATDTWRGPWQTAAAWGSFPSAHTTAAFALASALSWFYPRGRALFIALALIVAAQRVLHTAHYLSDVLAGIAIGVTTARATLHAKLAGRLLAPLPPAAQSWWARDTVSRA